MATKKALDTATGKAVLDKVKPALLAISPETLLQPNIDIQTAAMAALVLVDRANQGERKARFALLPSSVFPKGTVGDLEDVANAALHIEVQSAREDAATSGGKVDLALVQEGTQLRERMIKTADYNIGDREAVAREIADIRLGSGYLDLANDLSRLAALYTAYKSDLANDRRLYDAGDVVRATGLSSRIVAEYRASATRSGEYNDLRPRAYTELTRLYNEVRAAAQFIFRSEPASLDDFPPLRVATSALRPSQRAKRAGDPSVPAPTPAAPGAPAAPTAGGTNGSEPGAAH